MGLLVEHCFENRTALVQYDDIRWDRLMDQDDRVLTDYRNSTLTVYLQWVQFYVDRFSFQNVNNHIKS